MLKNKLLISLLGMSIVSLTMTGCAHFQQTGQYISSSAITTDVKAKLLASSEVKSRHISVTTIDKTVILSGYVHTRMQKHKAGEIARSADGVQAVENKLAIK